jgi:enterochelin esterase-like enzyme
MKRMPWWSLTGFLFVAACAISKDPEQQGRHAPDAGADAVSMFQDVALVDDTSTENQIPVTVTLVARPVYHPILPSGHGAAATVEFAVPVAATPTAIRLAEGVYRFGVDYEPDDHTDHPFVALAGSHERDTLYQKLFFVPRSEELMARVEEGKLILSRSTSDDSLGAAFDRAIEEVAQAGHGIAPVEELQHALRELNATPIATESLGHLFIAIGSEDEHPPELRGSFNGWTRQERFEFRPLVGRLWARYVTGIEGHHAYKIVYGNGAAWFTDLSNPNIEWDGIDNGGVGAFNSSVHPEQRPAGQGRLVWLPRVYSPELDNTREVYVYLPRSYDSSAGPYPLLIAHDGNESITRGRFHQVADAYETIIAFVALPDQNVRMAEYTVATEGSRGELHGRFLVDTLLPELERRFRVTTDIRRRGVAGVSLGGLMSFWTAMHYPTVFNFAGGMSSSFFWADEHIFDVLESKDCQDVVFYLDSGSPADNYQVTLAMRDRLHELACQHTHRVDEGGRHEWSFWNARFHHLLETFLAP